MSDGMSDGKLHMLADGVPVVDLNGRLVSAPRGIGDMLLYGGYEDVPKWLEQHSSKRLKSLTVLEVRCRANNHLLLTVWRDDTNPDVFYGKIHGHTPSRTVADDAKSVDGGAGAIPGVQMLGTGGTPATVRGQAVQMGMASTSLHVDDGAKYPTLFFQLDSVLTADTLQVDGKEVPGVPNMPIPLTCGDMHDESLGYRQVFELAIRHEHDKKPFVVMLR